MEIFKYKIQKTIDLGFEYRENLLKKDKSNKFEWLLNMKKFDIELKDDLLIQDTWKIILEPIKTLLWIFENIFEYDSYNNKNTIILDGIEMFYTKEKKKLPKEKNKWHEYYYEEIYKKFYEKFERLGN